MNAIKFPFLNLPIMFSRLFGSKKKEEEQQPADPNANWAFLGADMHSHFIPGIDDGAQTPEDTLALVKAMQEMGYTRLVTTPHINFDHYQNTPDTINAGLSVLHNVLKENNIDMPVKAAAEYFIDDYFLDLVNREPLLTVHNNQVLVELSFMYEPAGLNEIIFNLQNQGYRPILAHPERYGYMHHRPDIYRELKDRGCLLQLNTISLTGYYGKGIKMIAEKLVEEKLYDYCGSDMHHLKHTEALHSLLFSKWHGILSNYPFLNSKITF